MKKRRASGLVIAALASGFLFQSCSGLQTNIWNGFGLALGGIPAGLVTDYILGFINPPADAQ